MAVRTWSGVQVALTSATLAPINITAISKASPAVATFTGTAPVAGQIIWVTAQGMNQMNERAFRVGTVSGSTFTLPGVDSTTFNTFVSGTGQVQTMGIQMQSARGVTAGGGEATDIDISTIHDLISKTMPGPASASSFDFDCFWQPEDAALIALKSASDTRTQRVVQITWPDGAFILFGGYVSAPLLPTGSAGDVVTTPVRITMSGNPSIYVS